MVRRIATTLKRSELIFDPKRTHKWTYSSSGSLDHPHLSIRISPAEIFQGGPPGKSRSLRIEPLSIITGDRDRARD